MGGTPGARSVTSTKKINLAEEEVMALNLRRAGATIREVAAAMKISLGKAHKLIKRGISKIPTEARADLIHGVKERQLAIIASHWKNRHIPKHAKAIQDSEKILINVLGLSAPKRAELSIDMTKLSDEELQGLREGDEADPTMAGLALASNVPSDDGVTH